MPKHESNEKASSDCDVNITDEDCQGSTPQVCRRVANERHELEERVEEIVSDNNADCSLSSSDSKESHLARLNAIRTPYLTKAKASKPKSSQVAPTLALKLQCLSQSKPSASLAQQYHNPPSTLR